MNISKGDVWFVNFPLEENPRQFLSRPVIVLSADTEAQEILCIKVTKTRSRLADSFDRPIIYWQNAGLRYESTARISKGVFIPEAQFEFPIGSLDPRDLKTIEETFIEFCLENS